MIDKEVVGESFTVYFKGGGRKEYINSEKEEFQWALTQSGGLLIYRKQFHQTFGAVLKDGRIHAYAEGVWSEVKVHEPAPVKAEVIDIAGTPKDYAE